MSQRHMDLRVWPYPRPDYIFQVSSKSVQGFRSPSGVKIWPFPLLWLVAFTTACTTVQAVTSRDHSYSAQADSYVKGAMAPVMSLLRKRR